MGCDIHSYVESQNEDGSWERVRWEQQEQFDDGPFDWRSYAMYGFFADVRNYSAVPALAEPRGLPEDVTEWVRVEHEEMGWDAHSTSWFSVDELLAFDYDQEFEDRRVTIRTGPRSANGGHTADPGGGEVTTYREFLGGAYFRDLDILRALNEKRPTRFVFWFDN